MGTNYYLRRVRPREVHDEYHVCKTSIGWATHFQSDDWYHPERRDNPLLSPNGYSAGQLRWPDEVHGEVVPEWHEVADIRALLRSGDWQLADEHGTVFGPGEDSLRMLSQLCMRRGRDDGQFDYRDVQGHGFSRADFR